MGLIILDQLPPTGFLWDSIRAIEHKSLGNGRGIDVAQLIPHIALCPVDSTTSVDQCLAEMTGEQLPLNACFIDYLYHYQYEIPSQWKEKRLDLVFPGTKIGIVSEFSQPPRYPTFNFHHSDQDWRRRSCDTDSYPYYGRGGGFLTYVTRTNLEKCLI